MMTSETAISLLRRYRQKELSRPKHYSLVSWTMYEFGERVYTRYLVGELIRRIQDIPFEVNPFEVVRKFYTEIDDIMIDSTKPITKQFTKTVYRIVTDISEYLWAEEDKLRGRVDMSKLVYNILMKEDSDVQS